MGGVGTGRRRATQAQRRAGWARGRRRGGGGRAGLTETGGRFFRPLTSGPGAAAVGVVEPLGPFLSAPARPAAAARSAIPTPGHAAPRRPRRPLRSGAGPWWCPARRSPTAAAAPWWGGPWGR